MKVGFVSLGCPKNQLDTEVMLHEVASAGYEITPEETEADVVIINTCGFIESAKKEAIDNILDIVWLKKNHTLKAIVEEYADDIYTIADKDALVIPDLTAVKDYISSATLYVDSYSVYMQFNLTDAGKAADVKLSCGATSATTTAYAEKGFIHTNQTHIANLNDLYITITPAVAEGEEAAEPIVINFTLADYYALLAATGAQANTLALLESMYGYAVAGSYFEG